MQEKLDIPQEQLTRLCRKYHITSLSIFGSVARGDAQPDSDIDILIEFAPGHHPGLGLITLQDDLSALLGGRKVDLVSPKFLNHRIRDRVLAEAEAVYAER